MATVRFEIFNFYVMKNSSFPKLHDRRLYFLTTENKDYEVIVDNSQKTSNFKM